MRKERSTIIYFFIVLIILVGIALFVFKDDMVNQFLTYSGGEETVNSPVPINLNLDVLRDSRIKALKNYVSVFDYENLDKSQDAIMATQKNQSEVIITNPDEASTSTEKTTSSPIIRVRIGNSNPFIVNKVVK